MSTYDHYPPRGRQRTYLLPILLLLLIVEVAVLGWWFWPRTVSRDELREEPRPVMARGDLAEDEKAVIEIFRKVSPSVVHVTNIAEVRDGFSLKAQEVPRGTGSGFVWDEEGIIVTNYHVVKDAASVQVTLGDTDRSTYVTREVVAYPDKDLAILWLKDAPKSKLRPISIGTSENLQVGQKVVAIGNPFGLDQTLTTGVIGALGREIEAVTGKPIRGVIQTSAPINPGNSGGPLLDSAGLLIGVNTAILSPSGTFAGIGFAIPVDEVNRIVPRLIAELKKNRSEQRVEIKPPRIGVQIAPKQLAQQLGITEGILIVDVIPDGPAATAGLQPTRRSRTGQIRLGDVIVGIDDKEVKTDNDLYMALEQHKVGDTVALKFLRNGERKEVEVTLQAAE